MILRPALEDSPVYYHYYFSIVKEEDLFKALNNLLSSTVSFIRSIPPEKENYKYADDKWTVKQVLSHIIDTERIFIYRALRFSRKDATALPGYDENTYAPNANCEHRTLAEMAYEFELVRRSTISLFQYMTDEMLDFKGTANKATVTPRSIGWMIAGHNVHHCRIIGERYLY